MVVIYIARSTAGTATAFVAEIQDCPLGQSFWFRFSGTSVKRAQ